MKKVLISVNYLKDIGGIGTAALNLLDEIHDLYDVTLCVPSNFISPKYKIPENIKIIQGSNYLRDVIVERSFLSGQNVFQKILRNIRRVLNHYVIKTCGIEYALKNIKIEGQYDVAIAFADFAYDNKSRKCFDYYVVLNNVEAKKKIAWIHNEPTKLGWTKDLVKKELIGFDVVVNVSKDCKRVFDKIIPEFIDKSAVVYNMYNIKNIKSKAETGRKLYEGTDKIHLVTVARIQIKQKRIDRIIETCRRLKEEGISNFDWTLVGSSPEIDTLKEQVNSFDLQGIIRFAGLQSNPYPYMKQADAFVLSSEYEGFGMAVKESQILQTPTFATKFGAALEAIEDGKQGEVCDNSTEGLYNMIKTLVSQPQKLSYYRQYLHDQPVDNLTAKVQFDSIIS